MSFCPNCGAQLLEGAKFCHVCGTQVYGTSLYGAAQSTVFNSTRNDYRIVMASRGTCTKTNARELLMDIFGYTTAESNIILDSLPAEIACNLSFQQAVYAAQALSEYGVEVSVFNTDGYTDINRYAASSVYNSNGSFLSNVLSVLGTLTVANRLSKVTRWNRPVSYTFRPGYVRKAPATYVRNRKPEPPKPISKRPTLLGRDAPLHNAVSPAGGPRRDSSSNNTAANRAPRHDRPERRDEAQSIKKGPRKP